ncbi:MAG: proprotein convertase P-domain-containing protein [Saprospiraceae bacterium]|nr:proprotein convertase P-domain-containing protein [Saprospiraceae bacterium]
MKFFVAFLASWCIISQAPLNAQQWTIITEDNISPTGVKDLQPDKFSLYTMDDKRMKTLLWSAPDESSLDASQSDIIIQVAKPDQTIEAFSIVRYHMMEPELELKFPDIRTFYGVSVVNPYNSIRIDYTNHGFRAVISSYESKIFIDHFQRNDRNTKIVYYKSDYKKHAEWNCSVVSDSKSEHDTNNTHHDGSRIGDCQLRSYRLAQAATAEYSAFHGGTPLSVMSAVTTAINRINQVYEAEVAVRLILVANTDQLFYYNASTDPYTNNDGGAMLGENITTCNSVIGSGNYDIGHVFSTNGGGVAYLGAVCGSNKAGGVTGTNTPIGDPFTIDYVAHEMGHQFGGNHTQYNNCNRSANSAMEPGSASTIMGYAGICSPDVQSNSDAYFHARSLQEIKTFINTGSSCEQIIGSFVNSAPIVTSQSNRSIPVSTPFILTLGASDPEGHPITYAWEQMNAYTSPAQTMPPASSNSTGPVFRSITSTSSPSRYFPPLSNVINNTTNTWQVLPSVNRSMSFRGVARDFTGVAGCNSEINITVSTVNASSGAFSITSFNNLATWNEGDTKNITWNVANTNVAPVNAPNIDILLSYDGGNTYPITLVAGVPNDGSQDITVPSGTTTQARFMVRGSNHIFYDINNANLIIAIGGPNFSISNTPPSVTICQGQSALMTVTVTSILGFSNPVTFSLAGLPSGISGSFSVNPVSPGGSTVLTLTNTNAAIGNFSFNIQGVSGVITKSASGQISSLAVVNTVSSLILPDDGAVNMILTPDFKWGSVTNADSYTLQISRDITFNDIELSINSTSTFYQLLTSLTGLSNYYWRVRGLNNCSNGPWSVVRSLETVPCFTYSAADLPITISDSETPTINSYLPLTDKGNITDLDVLNLTGLHTYVNDLRFTLFSPSGNNVIVWNTPCPGDFDNFNINFDQAASNSNWPCPPIDGGSYIPSNSLNAFNNLQMKGQWRLQVQDLADVDGGSLSTWKIKTCVNNFCRLKVDNTYPSGAGSLFAAVNCAVDGDTIRFIPTLMNDTIFLGTQNLVNNKNLVIEGDISKNIHIISTSPNPVFVNNVPSGNQELKIKGLHIHSSNAGIGAINNLGKLTLEDVITYKWQGSSTATINSQTGATTTFIGNCKILNN